jgi:glycosyltransferase involved in cell wall biosynthesis
MTTDTIKLAFLGPANSFDYNQIGGTNSFIRRLSKELLNRGLFSVDYIHFGSKKDEIIHSPTFRSRYYPTFEDTIPDITDYDHIIVVYIPLKNLISFKKFCIQRQKRFKIHYIYWDWPESLLKRNIRDFFYTNIPYNGMSFAVSPRLYNNIANRRKEVQLLLPPVPPEYFVDIREKNTQEKLRVTFIGRIDKGKGIELVLSIFNSLSSIPEIDLAFYGTFWEKDTYAKKIHVDLSCQDSFEYIPVNFQEYSGDVDKMVRDALYHTDIFIQPYKQLSSTIDTPVLLLEAMASLSAVITTPVGDIPSIYPESRCLIPYENIVETAVSMIKTGPNWLPTERDKIFNQNNLLHFATPSVADQLIQTLKE